MGAAVAGAAVAGAGAEVAGAGGGHGVIQKGSPSGHQSTGVEPTQTFVSVFIRVAATLIETRLHVIPLGQSDWFSHFRSPECSIGSLCKNGDKC